MQDRYRCSILALCCFVLVGALACKDSTAPDPNASLFDRVRGTYEVSVVLDSLRYPDSCAPSSSSIPEQCHYTTVASGRRMHGFLTLADTIDASTFTTSKADMYFQVSAGTLTAINCDTCSSSTIAYPATIAVVRRDNPTFVVSLEPAGFLILEGQMANDEITGDATSATYLGSMPHDSYTGTFVAKRKP